MFSQIFVIAMLRIIFALHFNNNYCNNTCVGLFIQNATAAWRRSRRNGLKEQAKVVYIERDR